MPPGALGRLLEIAQDLASIQETLQIHVRRKKIILMAADHGITAQSVSPSSGKITSLMMESFVRGNSGVCVLAEQSGAEMVIVDAGVNGDLSAYGSKIIHGKIRRGTEDFSLKAAMTRQEALASLELGQAHSHCLPKIRWRNARISVILHSSERIGKGHHHAQKCQHAATDQQYKVLVSFDKLLCESKGKYGNEGIQCINYTRAQPRDKPRHMPFTQRLLHHKNGDRPYRG